MRSPWSVAYRRVPTSIRVEALRGARVSSFDAAGWGGIPVPGFREHSPRREGRVGEDASLVLVREGRVGRGGIGEGGRVELRGLGGGGGARGSSAARARVGSCRRGEEERRRSAFDLTSASGNPVAETHPIAEEEERGGSSDENLP